MGLDCEWRPSAYGGSGAGDPNSALGASTDHPVATLQLAFREEVFVIDLLAISGVVTGLAPSSSAEGGSRRGAESTPQGSGADLDSSNSNSNSDSGSGSAGNSNTSADGSVGSDSFIEYRLHPNSRGVLSTVEGALCAALGELFAHTKIAILGACNSISLVLLPFIVSQRTLLSALLISTLYYQYSAQRTLPFHPSPSTPLSLPLYLPLSVFTNRLCCAARLAETRSILPAHAVLSTSRTCHRPRSIKQSSFPAGSSLPSLSLSLSLFRFF